MKRDFDNNKGFTLIELLVVLMLYRPLPDILINRRKRMQLLNADWQ